MKEKKELFTEERTVYLAEDGRRFKRKSDCELYELELIHDKAERNLEQMPHFEYYPVFCDDYMTWSWYYARNNEELGAIKMTFFKKDCVAQDYSPKSYPCWLLCVHSELGDGRILGTLTEVRDNMLEDIDNIVKKQRTAYSEKYGEEPIGEEV